MKRFLKFSFTLVAAISLTATVIRAQQPMNMRACMQYAMQHSPQLEMRQASLNDDRISRREAILKAFTPSIDGGVYAYYNNGRAVDPQTNTYIDMQSFQNGYNLSAGITLFNGFEAVNNLTITRTALIMGVSEQNQEKDKICLATMEAYYNVLFYGRMSDIYARQVQTARESLELARRQEGLGLKPHAEVVQMESELADREYDQTLMWNRYNNALITLQDVMFWPLDSVLVIDTVMQESAGTKALNPEDVIKNALLTNPTLIIAACAQKNARLRLRTAQWQTLPSLHLYGGWSTSYFTYPGYNNGTPMPAFGSQFKNNGGEYVQLSLSIPIYDRLSRFHNIQRKKNDYTRATAEYDQMTREVESEVRRALQDRDGALAAYLAAQRKAEVQEQAYEVNVKRFEQGLISSIELQTATNGYLTAQADKFDALLKYTLKRSVVDYYSGIPYIEQNL